MIGFLVLLALVAVVALVVVVINGRNSENARKADELARVKRVADADVTRFGEELQELHIDTLTTELDVGMRQDYQRALDAYEDAKTLLAEAEEPEDMTEVTKTLEDGRHAQACVLARQAGEPLPGRRPPCFFNPAHGPARTDVSWAPAGGQEREIPVCLADAERIRAGAEPDARRVRDGNRMVPWYQGGPAYAHYANGYYGSYAMNGLFPAFLIGSMMGGLWSPAVIEPPADAGGSDWSSDDAGGVDGADGADQSGDFGSDFGNEHGGGDGGGFGGGDWGGGFDGGGGFDF